jgi:hypothetical protein
MRVITVLCFVSFVSLTLSSCSTLPETFSTENVMKIHQGMSSDEILSMFGKPNNIRVAVCGESPNNWNCTTWKYGELSGDNASFTFSGRYDSLKLNDFNVDKSQGYSLP